LNKKKNRNTIRTEQGKEIQEGEEKKVKIVARRKKSTRMMANYGMPLNQSRPRGGKDMTLQRP